MPSPDSVSGCKNDACQRISPAERISADLVSSPCKPSHVVQSGGRIEETLLSERIYFTLRLEESGQLQEQGLAIHWLAQELPRTSAVSLEALGAAGGSGGRDDERECWR